MCSEDLCTDRDAKRTPGMSYNSARIGLSWKEHTFLRIDLVHQFDSFGEHADDVPDPSLRRWRIPPKPVRSQRGTRYSLPSVWSLIRFFNKLFDDAKSPDSDRKSNLVLGGDVSCAATRNAFLCLTRS